MRRFLLSLLPLLALAACGHTLPPGEWRGTLHRFYEDGREHSRRWPAPVIIREDGTMDVTDWYEVAEPVLLPLDVSEDTRASWESDKTWRRPSHYLDCEPHAIIYESGTVEVKGDGALEVHAEVRLLQCGEEARMHFVFTGTQEEPPLWTPCEETEPGEFCAP